MRGLSKVYVPATYAWNCILFVEAFSQAGNAHCFDGGACLHPVNWLPTILCSNGIICSTVHDQQQLSMAPPEVTEQGLAI